MIDNVQLKQEEAVGNDVVLNDINPKTNTRSIDDSSSGLPLSYTLDRLWEAINNKLSRYVNSVNGRTGVVVLDKSDVGLDKVDNVSYSEIKDWVINRIQDEFKYKTLQLFNEYNEVNRWVLQLNNDPIYSGTPFYSEHGPGDDRRAYIGYIEYSNSMLNIHHKPINTIGAADNSIIYNENVGGKLYEGTGTIGVNIWSGQDVIKIHEGLTKDDSGLYIDGNKLSKDVYFFNSVYGDGTSAANNALVYYNPSTSTRPTGGQDLVIKINGTQYGENLYTLRTFKFGDIVLTNFSSEGCTAPESDKNKGIILKEGILPELVEKQPGFGIVKTTPDEDHPNTPYTIDFYTIRPNTTSGLKIYNDNGDTAIGIDLLMGGAITNDGQILDTGETPTNISGLNTLDQKRIYSEDDQSGTGTRTMKTILPTGESGDPFGLNGTKELSRTATGVFISPSYSLNVIPTKCFPSETTPDKTINNGSNPLTNWPPRNIGDLSDCSIGVNLMKVVDNPNDPNEPNLSYGINLSGLRIDRDSEQLSSNWLGYTRMNPVTYVRVYNEPFGWDNTCTDYYYKDQYGGMHRVTAGAIFDSFTYGIFKRYQDIKHSGGLSVNVGDFLKIGYQNNLVRPSSDYKDRQTFYDDGKVNLNIDTKLGLGEITTNSNELGIRIADGDNYSTSNTDTTLSRQGGLKFTFKPETPDIGYLATNTGDNTSDAGGLYVNNKNILGVKLYNTINDVTNPCSEGKINEPKSVDILKSINENDLIEHISLMGRNPDPNSNMTQPIEELCYHSIDDLTADFRNWIDYDGKSIITDVSAMEDKVHAGMDSRWNQVYNIEGVRYIWDPIDTDGGDDFAGRVWESLPIYKSKYGYFKRLFQIYKTIEESPVNITDPTLVSNNDKRYIYVISQQLETGAHQIKDGKLQIYTWNDPVKLMVPNITNGIYDENSTQSIVNQMDQPYASAVYSALSTAVPCYLYEPGETPAGPKYQTYYSGSLYEKSVYVASTAYYFGSSTPGGNIPGERGEYVDGVFYRGSGQTNPITPQKEYVYTDIDLSTSIVKDYYYYDFNLNKYIKIDRYTLLTEKPADFNTHPENYYKLRNNGVWIPGTSGAVWAVNTWYSFDDTQVILNNNDNTKILFAKKIDPIALGSKTSYRPCNIPNRSSDPYGNYYMAYEYRDSLPSTSTPVSPGIQDGYMYRPIMPLRAGIFITTDIMARLDMNKDGNVDMRDESVYLYYTSHRSTFDVGSPANQRTWWMNFCTTPKEEGGLGFKNIYDGPTPPYGGWFLQYKDNTATTGLKVGYNQHRGLTSNANSYIYMESEKDHSGFDEHLSIKIADSSAGIYGFDTSTNGGLRFTTDGFLAVRINDQNNYDASISSKRGRAYRGDRISESITAGTRGLRIYNENVLGVQLSPDGSMDNGTLMIDASGCLKISNAYTAHGGVAVEKFIMTDGTNRVEYNGGEEVTLTIGPGLKLVP